MGLRCLFLFMSSLWHWILCACVCTSCCLFICILRVWKGFMQMNRLESEEFRWAVALPILFSLLLYLYSTCLWPQLFLPIGCCHIYLSQRMTAYKDWYSSKCMHTKDTLRSRHTALTVLLMLRSPAIFHLVLPFYLSFLLLFVLIHI